MFEVGPPREFMTVAIPAPPHLPAVVSLDAAKDLLRREADKRGLNLGPINATCINGEAVAGALVLSPNPEVI
jgi:hypothetical protein